MSSWLRSFPILRRQPRSLSSVSGHPARWSCVRGWFMSSFWACTGSRSRCWRTGAWSNAYSPRDWFAAIDLKDACFHVSILPRHRPFLRFASKGRAWQYRVLPFGLSLSPRVFTKVAEGALAPLQEVGIRILNCLEHGPLARTVVRSQGPGASAPQPVGASGQLGKKQALPCAENLFSWCGVRLGEYDGAPHGRARPIRAELPEFFQRQGCGSAENSFRGSWDIWHPQLQSRRSDCFKWDHFSTGCTPESRDGHGAAVHFGWTSHRSVAATSAPGRTLLFYGPGCP